MVEPPRRQSAALGGWKTGAGKGVSCNSGGPSSSSPSFGSGRRRRRSPGRSTGGPASKTCPLPSVQSSNKRLASKRSLSLASQQNTAVRLKPFSVQFSACGEPWILLIFPDFEYEFCLFFNVKTFPWPGRPCPAQLQQEPEHLFKSSAAFVVRTITSYYLISATHLTQLCGALFHDLGFFVFLP